MNTIVERITEAIKDILINFIQSGMEDMFVEVNNKVGTIAAQVGQTPQGWNGSVFSLIKNLSETVMVPIAGMIITFVLCYELDRDLCHIYRQAHEGGLQPVSGSVQQER